MTHGKNAMAKSDWTIGTAAPGSGDLELRINTTDGLGRTITRHDVRLFVEGLERSPKGLSYSEPGSDSNGQHQRYNRPLFLDPDGQLRS